ncbi:MAG: DUF4434 domain-containing protein [Anaerolineaceae bacterium]|nr:DUF4434 domain-containing protein [Anaerolineaceae bacterium]
MKITGTFLDEITHDIPSNNWDVEEWAADFDAMRAVGIDTVILIRAGYRDRVTFNSETLSRELVMRPAYIDLVDLFLTQAERTGMTFYFGIYDSGRFWHQGQPEKEVELNLRFTEEVARKYGDRKAFGGWYMTHEIHEHDEGVTRLIERLARHVKGLKDVPVLMSPYVRGRKQFDDNPITPEEHEAQWDEILSILGGFVDTIAFQDGQVEFAELPVFMEINTRLARKHGLQPWSNVESFERGMPLNFLPIDWRNLRNKIEVAEAGGVEKLITFEFSHFMSPNSMWPSARTLYKRYQEYIDRG